MIRFTCPLCGMQLSAPEDCAGRVSKCRACGQPVTIPPAIPTSTKPAPPKELSDSQFAKAAPPAMIPNVPDLGPIQFKPVAAGGTPKPEEPVEVVPVVEDDPMVVRDPEVLPAKVEVPPRRDRQRSKKTPVPTGTKSYRKVIVAAIAATFTVGFLFGCCAASVVFWMFPRVQSVLPEGEKAAVNKAPVKPRDDMTFQELEDRLNSAGVKVTRTASKFRNVMWFGNQINRQAVMAWEDANCPGVMRGCMMLTVSESRNMKVQTKRKKPQPR